MDKILNIIPAVNIPPGRNQVFSYLRPNNSILKQGQSVLIPFAGRKITGVVDYNQNSKKSVVKLKKIIKKTDDNFVLSYDHYKLAKWISEHYYCSLGLTIKLMLQRKVNAREITENEIYLKTNFPKLNHEQTLAYQSINKEINNDFASKTYLLHGITGSGKTEIYMKLIDDCLKDNKQSIVLIPEISLTPQIMDRFIERFGSSKVAVLHSRLSLGEKYYYWNKIYSNKAKIIIGPRSAIFAPARKLGLIIIDEEHDASFKQYDQNPRYHARSVAIKLSQIKNIPLVLGSATPSIESYYKAQKKEYHLIELKQRFKKNLKLPPVDIIDMREELKKGNFSILSEKLAKAIKHSLAKKKQILLFINRRGSSTFVMCRDCGYVADCPNCDVSLTYHTNSKVNKMICHHCGYFENIATVCPKCQSKYIKYFGVGTQKVEEQIKYLFPKARIIRIDKDTMNKKNIHQASYQKMHRQNYDIIIGTQMITKGLDLSNIELVGIIASDVLFNFPDFRTNERAFQSLMQVAGRTSRRFNTGRVITQTYNPDNKIIKYAARHDYDKFFNNEIVLRKDLNYPPFKNIIKLIFIGINYANTYDSANKFCTILKKIAGIEIIGPAPAFIPKKRNRYQINLIIKYRGLDIKKNLIKILSDDTKIDVDPENLL